MSKRRKYIKAAITTSNGPHDSRYKDRTQGSYYGRRKEHLAPRRARRTPQPYYGKGRLTLT